MSVIKEFSITSAIETETFDYKRDFSNLFGLIAYIGTMEDGIVLFKKHYPVLHLSRDSFLLMFKTNRIEKIPNADILRVNGDYQVIKLGDDIYVSDVKVLEKNLGFTSLIKKEAKSAIQLLNQMALVENTEVLQESIEEPTFARNLAKAMRSSPVFVNSITKEKILDFIKNTDKLRQKFRFSEDGKSIRLTTKKSKEDFVKLLNDNYLRSELTNEYYDACSKNQI